MTAQARALRQVCRLEGERLVFVVQNPQRMDESTETYVPKYDTSQAAAFGRIVNVLSPAASPFGFHTLLDDLHNVLKEYRQGDHVLLIGNPVLIGAVVAIAAAYSRGKVAVLQWSGRDKCYVSIDMTQLCVR